MPLCKDFSDADWEVMALRFNLHLLVHAFRRDVNDPERTGIKLADLPFYYERYYGKRLNAKDFGCESVSDVLALVRDTVFINDKDVLESVLDDEMECLQIFVKLAEAERRHRGLRLDLGDETARLKVWSRRSGNDGQWGGQQQWQQGGQQKSWGDNSKSKDGKGYGDHGKGKGWRDSGKGASHSGKNGAKGQKEVRQQWKKV